MGSRAARLSFLAAVLVATECTLQPGVPPDAGAADGGPAPRTPDDHRPVAVPCDSPRPSQVPDGGFDAVSGACADDVDCSDGGSNGRCILNPTTGATSCTFDECRVDVDCGVASVCACRSGSDDMNSCVPADCQVDADCGAGGYCSPVVLGCAGLTGITGYYCHTPRDACVNDSDCVDTAIQDLHCVFAVGPNGRWVCGPVDCSG